MTQMCEFATSTHILLLKLTISVTLISVFNAYLVRLSEKHKVMHTNNMDHTFISVNIPCNIQTLSGKDGEIRCTERGFPLTDGVIVMYLDEKRVRYRMVFRGSEGFTF